jgi:hypothetical protein
MVLFGPDPTHARAHKPIQFYSHPVDTAAPGPLAFSPIDAYRLAFPPDPLAFFLSCRRSGAVEGRRPAAGS